MPSARRQLSTTHAWKLTVGNVPDIAVADYPIPGSAKSLSNGLRRRVAAKWLRAGRIVGSRGSCRPKPIGERRILVVSGRLPFWRDDPEVVIHLRNFHNRNRPFVYSPFRSRIAEEAGLRRCHTKGNRLFPPLQRRALRRLHDGASSVSSQRSSATLTASGASSISM